MISNNDEQGIWIVDGSTGNKIQGNWIGIDTTGESHLGNNYGVVLSDMPGNTIGGTAPGGNVLSTNRESNIYITSAVFMGVGSPNTLIQGNLIGTDATGQRGLDSPAGAGVLLDAGSNCTIGGTSANARNVISDNIDGIEIRSGVLGTVIQGNYIGTDASGTNPLGNFFYGIDQLAGAAGPRSAGCLRTRET